MSTSKPRVYVTLDDDLYKETRRLAKKKKISMSLFLRDKIKEAMEWHDTFELLQDREAVKTIQEGLEEIRRGEPGVSIRKYFKDL